MFATQWIKHAEATMLDHPNHPVPSGYKLREVPRFCTECKTKKVGKSYSKCYTCRHESWFELAESNSTAPVVTHDEKPVVTFTRGQESSEPNECNPTKHDVVEPVVTFTYSD